MFTALVRTVRRRHALPRLNDGLAGRTKKVTKTEMKESELLGKLSRLLIVVVDNK